MDTTNKAKINEQTETVSADPQVLYTGIGTDQIQKDTAPTAASAHTYVNQKSAIATLDGANMGKSIAAAAKRMHEKSSQAPKASPLLNSLIKKVVKEQDAKAETMRWEHLVNMHSQINAYLYNLTSISAFMRNKILLAEVAEKEKLLRLTKVLASDMGEIQKRTMANSEQYPIKTGEITDDQDMLMAIGIYEVYNQILLDIVNNLMPISDQVMEMFTVAERIIVEKEKLILASQSDQAQADLVDPAVISDVPVKEVVAETVTEAVAQTYEAPVASAP